MIKAYSKARQPVNPRFLEVEGAMSPTLIG